MRRSRRQREEENEMIQAIKWWQNQVVKGMLFGLIPALLLYAGFVWWIGTPAGEEFTGWTDFERHNEQRIESLNDNAEKRYNEFTESTNEDVQNTIDDIQGTEDATGTEQYSEEVQSTINELEQ
jgi:hypothetical protein